jgi:hypothetical protein
MLTYTVWIDQSAISVEFTLFEIALVSDTVWELEAALALLPVMIFGALVF